MTYGDEERRNRVKVANDDTRIEKVDQVLPPIALLEKFPASQEAADLVHETRLHAHNIIHGKDDRFTCSNWSLFYS